MDREQEGALSVRAKGGLGSEELTGENFNLLVISSKALLMKDVTEVIE